MRVFRAVITIIIISFTIPQIGNGQSLTAFYPFNCNANDASGNGNNGIVYGAIFGDGQCVFDGQDDYIDLQGLTYPPNSNTGSISVWFNYGVADDSVTLLTKSTNFSNIDCDFIWLSQDRSIIYQTKVGDLTAGRRTDPGIFSLSDWHHLVITADGTNSLLFYLDGQLTPSTSYWVDSENRFFDMGDSWVIGKFFREQEPGNVFFKGSMKDLRFYDSPLSADQVQNLFVSNIGICTPICGDINGDCHSNGIDIVYYVNYLKGGPALIARSDCQ
jgi:hypothetical protein